MAYQDDIQRMVGILTAEEKRKKQALEEARRREAEARQRAETAAPVNAQIDAVVASGGVPTGRTDSPVTIIPASAFEPEKVEPTDEELLALLEGRTAIPVPMARPDVAAQDVTASVPTTAATVAPVTEPAAPAEEEKKWKNPLRDLFGWMGAESDDQKSALSDSLIRAGAAMMTAGADGYNWVGALGKGLEAGSTGYDDSIKAMQDGRVKDFALGQAKLKTAQELQSRSYQQQAADIIASAGRNGDYGLAANQLYQLAEAQTRAGDEAGARQTLDQIQQLQQYGAKNGYVVRGGEMTPAAGMLESTQATEAAKSYGRKAGEQPFVTTSDLTELNRVNSERKANGQAPISAEDWIKQSQSIKKTVPNADDKYNEEVAKEQAKAHQDYVVQANQARLNKARLEETQRLLDKTPGGWKNGPLQLAANVGIKLADGADEVAAAKALISQQVPEFRPPGSGASSDMDTKMFIESGPELMRTPEGNRLVIDTLIAMNDYKLELGRIAARAQNGEITRTQANQMMLELADPLTKYKNYVKQTQGTNTTVTNPSNEGAPRYGRTKSGKLIRLN
ncbi:hypothetical protein [Rhizobium sp. P007]|uniref:hypothetical protein n=1 Tax=Rhizobium sp. P007 TaxID=285908 RepID=UPI001158BF0E|nr:hypothetical protein [Rhizobium sp. P007]CAD7041268.1 hypothetical protein RP007_00729 [Rhizobium sp. P007]